MIRKTHTTAATTVDSEEVVGVGRLEELRLPGEGLLDGEDPVSMPAHCKKIHGIRSF